MKFLKFVKVMGAFKFLAAMYFLMSMLLTTIVAAFYGVWEFQTIFIWQIAVLSMLGALLHNIYFTEWKLGIKIIVHILSVYLLAVAAAFLFDWSFVTSNATFLEFSAIFMVLYGFAAFGWSIYYKAENKELNKKLDEYKKSNNRI